MYPPNAFRLLPPLLLIALSAAAQDLRDSGYGDGSLVDGVGNYYYPQPDGAYLDAYGSTYAPLGDGTYSDAIGNRVDAGDAWLGAPGANGAIGGATGDQGPNRERPRPFAAPSGDRPLPHGEDADHATTADEAGDPAAGHSPGDTRDPAATRHEDTRNTDPWGPAEHNEFGSMYLEDAGDGYLASDAAETAAGTTGTRTAPPEASGGPAASIPDLWPEPPFAADTHEDTAAAVYRPDQPEVDVKPQDRRYDDSAQFKGTAHSLQPFARDQR